MELKATSLGKRLAQHPYDRAVILNAGIKVSGDRHEYLIPFNQLLALHCKRGLVWGELEFVLLAGRVVRLHGTAWMATQRFYHRLNGLWRQWSEEMSEIAAGVLREQQGFIDAMVQEDRWLTYQQMQEWKKKFLISFSALPLPPERLNEFDNCRDLLRRCQTWLEDAQTCRLRHNRCWSDRIRSQYAEFFSRIESFPLSQAQAEAVVNGERSLLVLAGAGSGKSSLLIARAGWLIERGETAAQILLLTVNRKAAEEMDGRLRERLSSDDIAVRDFHNLALDIIRQGGNKTATISRLENDTQARLQLLISSWQRQCGENKTQAKGWRQWLQEMGWSVPQGEFWNDERLARRTGARLDRWLRLMNASGARQAGMIAGVSEGGRPLLAKRVRLMAPLLKAWRLALKEEYALDAAQLMRQAITTLEKGNFVMPWKHILLDHFQDLSGQYATLLAALHKLNSHVTLFAVGDEGQANGPSNDGPLSLATTFYHYFAKGDCCRLDSYWHGNQRIGEIAHRFMQQEPRQHVGAPRTSVAVGDKKAVTLLPEEQLEALLDKLSGYAKPDDRILLLARYHYLKPVCLEKAATRWPKLALDFMTIHASKGQQADYVILPGLCEGEDGFPALADEFIPEQALMPQVEDFPDMAERRLLYIALTRARQRVWLLYDKARPSRFVEALKQLGVPLARRP